MKYMSLCSGIEAATVAWEPLGWKPQLFSEFDKFPSAVLDRHYPDIPNMGDMTNFKEWGEYETDVVVGGTPCQSFSIAGLRKGLDDPRGNLMLTYLAIIDRYRPRWVVWENVPGVLSSNKGRDFGTFLWALGKFGYGWSYRSLDAQYFGVPQRRKRVFVIGYLGNWQRAAAVLFERHSMSGHTAPSREKRENIAVCFERRSQDGVPRVHGEIAPTLNRMGGGQREPCIAKSNGLGINEQAVAFAENTRNELRESEIAPALQCQGGKPGQGYSAIRQDMQVRKLTPTECERLQGFPDNYTQIPWRDKPAEECPTGHRYKALGNSMAVPVMRWIGERIQMVDSI